MINFYKAYLSQALNAGTAASSIFIDSITTMQGETLTTSDFADMGRGILTLNPSADGNIDYPENVSFTTVTATAFTGAIRGLDKAGVTQTSLMRYHPVGTPVIISIGVHNIADLKTYIDAQVAAVTIGSSSVVLGTAGETLTAGQLVYLKNDGKWWKTDADTAATVDGVQLGIAQGAGATDAAITGGVLLHGLDTHQTGLVAGTTYYAGNTAGGISSSAGTNSRVVGVGRSATSIYFDNLSASTINASETAKGFVEIATQAQFNAGTASGETGASLAITPALIKASTNPIVRTYLAAASPATWTKPTGLKYVVVEVQAAGGNGGAANGAGTNTASVGGGGGGGGYSKKLVAVATLGTTETITIGAAGNPSSFGAHASATAGANGTDEGAGGAGGIGSSGDINIKGGGGGSGTQDQTSIFMPGSTGGSSVLGGGGAGLGSGYGPGNAGGVYGGGGGGGVSIYPNGNQTGGAGGAAIVIVTEFYS